MGAQRQQLGRGRARTLSLDSPCLIFTSGDVSVMSFPRSSIWPFTSSSMSTTDASSCVSFVTRCVVVWQDPNPCQVSGPHSRFTQAVHKPLSTTHLILLLRALQRLMCSSILVGLRMHTTVAG